MAPFDQSGVSNLTCTLTPIRPKADSHPLALTLLAPPVRGLEPLSRNFDVSCTSPNPSWAETLGTED